MNDQTRQTKVAAIDPKASIDQRINGDTYPAQRLETIACSGLSPFEQALLAAILRARCVRDDLETAA